MNDVTKDLLEALKAFDVLFACQCKDSTQRHWLDNARAAIARAEGALAEPQPDADGPWKSAVIDQLVIAHILTAEHENDPLKAVQDLLAYHADIAVDPRVSGAAAKLVEQAKADVESAATERANERANASWALMCEKMVAAEREACANVLDEGWFRCQADAVAAIRARGQK